MVVILVQVVVALERCSTTSRIMSAKNTVGLGYVVVDSSCRGRKSSSTIITTSGTVAAMSTVGLRYVIVVVVVVIVL